MESELKTFKFYLIRESTGSRLKIIVKADNGEVAANTILKDYPGWKFAYSS